jgi:hypothetical protein
MQHASYDEGVTTSRSMEGTTHAYIPEIEQPTDGQGLQRGLSGSDMRTSRITDLAADDQLDTDQATNGSAAPSGWYGGLQSDHCGHECCESSHHALLEKVQSWQCHQMTNETEPQRTLSQQGTSQVLHSSASFPFDVLALCTKPEAEQPLCAANLRRRMLFTSAHLAKYGFFIQPDVGGRRWNEDDSC